MRTLQVVLFIVFIATHADSCGCIRRTNVKIGVIYHGGKQDAFWTGVQKAHERAASDLNVNLHYQTPDTFDLQTMAEMIAGVGSDMDGFVVSIPGTSIRDAVVKRNVSCPTVVVNAGDSALPFLRPDTVYLGMRDADAGKAAASLFIQAKKQVAICVDHQGGLNGGLLSRCAALKAQMHAANGSSFTVAVSGSNVAQQMAALTTALNVTYPNASAILCGKPAYTGTKSALNALRKNGNIAFASVNYNGAHPVDFSSKLLNFVVDQQPYMQGYLPVILLTLRAQTGLWAQFEERVVQTGPSIITADNYYRKMCSPNDVMYCSDPADLLAANLPIVNTSGKITTCKCIDKSSKTISVLWPVPDDKTNVFWMTVASGMNQASLDAKIGLEYVYESRAAIGTNDLYDKLDALSASSKSDVSGLLVIGSQYNAERLTKYVNHTIIQTLYSQTEATRHLHHIGADQFECGVVAAKQMLKQQQQQQQNLFGTVWCVIGKYGDPELTQRCSGFTQTMSAELGSGIAVSVLTVDGGNPSAAQEQLRVAFVDANNVKAVLTTDVSSLLPMARFIESVLAQDGKRPIHGTIDVTEYALELHETGHLEFFIDQQPFLQGYLSVSLLAQRIFHGAVPANLFIKSGPLVNFAQRSKDQLLCEAQNTGWSVCPNEKWTIVYNDFPLSTMATMAFRSVYSIGILSLAIEGVLLYGLRKHRVILSSSPQMLAVSTVGGFLALVAGLISIEPRKNAYETWKCNAPFWLLHIAFDLVVGSLLVKTRRLHLIFNIRLLKVLRLTTFKLMSWLAVILGIDIMLLLAWNISQDSLLRVQMGSAHWSYTRWSATANATETILPITARPIANGEFEGSWTCNAQTHLVPQVTLVWLLWSTKIVIALWLGRVTFAIRKIPLEYNDTLILIASWFVIAFMGLLGLASSTELFGSMATQTAQTLFAVLVLLAVAIVVVILSIGTKLWTALTKIGWSALLSSQIRRSGHNNTHMQTRVQSGQPDSAIAGILSLTGTGIASIARETDHADVLRIHSTELTRLWKLSDINNADRNTINQLIATAQANVLHAQTQLEHSLKTKKRYSAASVIAVTTTTTATTTAAPAQAAVTPMSPVTQTTAVATVTSTPQQQYRTAFAFVPKSPRVQRNT